MYTRKHLLTLSVILRTKINNTNAKEENSDADDHPRNIIKFCKIYEIRTHD